MTHSYLIKLGDLLYLTDKTQWTHDLRLALEFASEPEALAALAQVKHESGLYEARIVPNTMAGVSLLS